MMSHNLLREALLRVVFPDGTRKALTLPGVLAQLSVDEIVAFEALQVHQQHPWHAFLVQLGAIALARQGLMEPPKEEEAWLKLLLACTEGAEEPWCLWVKDLSKPAFLQPPIPEDSLSVFRGQTSCSDDLDIFVTAKSHDIKVERAVNSKPEHWLFALLSLQTMQGFSAICPPKKFYWGIARMNSGYGNRPGVSFAPGLAIGARFRRDLLVCLRNRPSLCQEAGYSDKGHALIWILPWDGTSSLSLTECDPYFIEICRRVRLSAGLCSAHYDGTAVTRMAAIKDLAGKTSDPWTPVDKADNTALTVPKTGFSYRLLYRLLFGEFTPGIAQQLQAGDNGDINLICYALSRGKGKTEGLHQRVVPVPGKTRKMLSSDDERTRFGTRAKRFIDDAKTMENKVLRFAVAKLLTAGKEGTHDHSGHWAARMDDEVDRVFFPDLWSTFEQDDEGALLVWQKTLQALAWSQLQEAIDEVPLPAARRYRAISSAEGTFWGSLYKNFETLKPKTIQENP